jgi:hypothetical protein
MSITSRRSILLAGAAASAPLLMTRTLKAAKGGGGGELAAAVTGRVLTTATGVTSFAAGTLTIERFVAQAGQLLAIGNVVLRLTDALGNVISTLTQAVQIVTSIGQNSTCTVLELVLGPLHLELLGLVIDLNRVVLTITADPSGGLLGQLLCALAGGGTLDVLAGLLNQLLGLFASV